MSHTASMLIQSVVTDLMVGRVTFAPNRHKRSGKRFAAEALARVQQPTVIDTTGTYRELVERDEPVAVYEDHPYIGSAGELAIGYLNEHGNVIVTHVHTTDVDVVNPWRTGTGRPWSDVATVADAVVWVGGHGGDGRTIGTIGPWDMALLTVLGTLALPEADREIAP